MANIISEGDRNLVRLDYSSLLAAILNSLKNSETGNPFKIFNEGKQVAINVDTIAYFIVINSSKIESPLIGNSYNTKVATVNFASDRVRDNFVKQNREIRDCLQQLFSIFITREKRNLN